MLCDQGDGAFLRIAPQRYKFKEPLAKRRLWSLHLQCLHLHRQRQQLHRGAKSQKPKDRLACEVSFGQNEGKSHHIFFADKRWAG